LELNAADVAQVLEATTIVAEALMETYNAGNDPVKLRTDATLNLSLGLEFKVSVIQ
jgi:hypothetical protein